MLLKLRGVLHGRISWLCVIRVRLVDGAPIPIRMISPSAAELIKGSCCLAPQKMLELPRDYRDWHTVVHAKSTSSQRLCWVAVKESISPHNKCR